MARKDGAGGWIKWEKAQYWILRTCNEKRDVIFSIASHSRGTGIFHRKRVSKRASERGIQRKEREYREPIDSFVEKTNRVPDYLLGVRIAKKASVCALVEMVARHCDCCAREFSIQLNVLSLHAQSIHILENWIAQYSKCSALLASPVETPPHAEREKIHVETEPIAETDRKYLSWPAAGFVLRCKSILLIPRRLLRYILCAQLACDYFVCTVITPWVRLWPWRGSNSPCLFLTLVSLRCACPGSLYGVNYAQGTPNYEVRDFQKRHRRNGISATASAQQLPQRFGLRSSF